MAKVQHSERRSLRIGLLLVLGAAVLWSLNGALIKLVHRDGAGPGGLVIAFYRSLFAGLFLLPIARRRLGTLLCTPSDAGDAPAILDKTAARERKKIGKRGGLRPAAACCVVFYTLMTVCFVVANTKTEAANAIILQYTSTFWIFGLSPWLLREKAKRSDVGLLAFAVLGIGIVFAGNASSDLFGLLNGLAAGLFFALLTMMIRRLKDCDAAAVTVLNNLGSAALLLPFVLAMDGLSISKRSLALLVFMGVVQFGLPYYLFALGLARIRAYQASLVSLAEPVLVPVWAFLAVGEAIPLPTSIGGGIVLLTLILFLVRR